ncbi:hypothetical protein BKA59DRAFT_29104 [Fusarium tricinctum]|uniref:Mitochondrial ATPase expression-domain-containing protein n=1 Tax=Fusarium tricinctum TaxID=61284 RepID=A0A8K0S9V3_9HYPO|nr:hypothetical protein BKA59DRAFT_29104 [Fusarium tricinctum]
MLRRQSLLRGPYLDRSSITPLATALRSYGPPLRAGRPAEVGRRRWLASISPLTSTLPSTFAHQRGASLSENNSTRITPLDNLLRAIRCRDAGYIIEAFRDWVMSFNDENPQVVNAALQELVELPTTTFSAILRALDPIENPELDVAHGIKISQGEMQFTNACHLIDDFGVRHQHRFILNALKALLEARREAGRTLVINDYEVLIRCAGAASDINEAIFWFGAITRDGLQPKRTTATWNVFLRARYQIDPVYYQYDRQRVTQTSRDAYRIFFETELKNVWRMESLRHSRNALLKLPFNRQPRRLWASNYLWMRQKTGYQSYFAHWRRSKDIGVLLNEEMLCNALIGFARSGSLAHIRGIVLKRGFGIGLVENKEAGTFKIGGNKTFREGNPRAPTVRLLNAIVEGFGGMSRIRLALDLLIHVSKAYSIPIPRETWSNLYNWAYSCSTKPNRPQRQLMQKPLSAVVDHKLVTEIWDTMTSEPYNMEPTFENYMAYTKSLIFRNKFNAALDVIRDHAVPHYRRLEEEHQQIVFNEVLQEMSGVSHQRVRIETQKDNSWYQIHDCLSKLFKGASMFPPRRKSKFPYTALPNLVAEFNEFFSDQIRYRTSQGYVTLERSVEVPRFTWSRQKRTTLPQLKGGLEIKMMETRGLIEEEPTFEGRQQKWPRAREMVIKEWKRNPIARLRAGGPAPESTDVNAREWWKRVEGELML